MRSFLAAVGAALRTAFSIAGALVMLPFNIFGRLFGPSVPAPPSGDSELVKDLKEKVRADNAKVLSDAANRAAKVVSNWCMDCIIEDRLLPAPIPPRVPRAVANWLPGLTREEVEALIGCEIDAIRGHIEGKALIEGVRPVQKLDAKKWKPATPEPAWNPCVAEPLFVTHAAYGAR